MVHIMKSDNNPAQALANLLQTQLPKNTVIAVALSGGMDSTSLLEATRPLQEHWQVTACHVNHGISRRADAWENFCRRLCLQNNIPLSVFRTSPPSIASEDWARQERMKAFSKLPVSAIITAHHADDQAETVLFRLLRGSGVYGMAAMRSSSALPGAPHIQLLRPWLNIRRDVIARYASQNKLSWVEDEDNENLSRRRNFLRRRALPVLAEGFNDCNALLAATAPRFAEDAKLLTDLAMLDEKQAATDSEGFSLPYWQSIGKARISNWLRVLLSRRYEGFSRRHVEEAARQIMAATPDSPLCFKFRSGNLRAWRNRLFWDETPPPPENFFLPLKATAIRLPLTELGGTLVLSPARGKGLATKKVANGLILRLRQGGEKLSSIGRPRRAVSDLLREANIMPWRRVLLPLLFVRGQLAAVPGVATANDFTATADEEGLECAFEWR